MNTPTPLGYPGYTSGLNNQRLALFGLFCEAAHHQRPLTLPAIASYDSTGARHTLIPFAEVFDPAPLTRFATAFGLNILDQPPADNQKPQNTFVAGANRIATDAIRGPAALDGFTCQFFRHLKPRITATPLFQKLQNAIFTQHGIKLAAQFRIEKDWIPHTEAVHKNTPQLAHNVYPGPAGIAAKLKSAFPAERQIYITSDEHNLPAPKSDIRAAILEQTGIAPFWKSHFLSPAELAPLSFLDQCLLDFEIAQRAEIFTGISLSTFSNLTSFEYFCRHRRPAEHHLIYNIPGPGLARRWDNGATFEFYKITSPLLRRAPLIPDAPTDILWPAALTTHIAEFGDLTCETSETPGLRRGHLAAGLPGHPSHHIEGLSIAPLGGFAPPLEYRARLADGSWTPWLPLGRFAGTRGEKKPLLGFAVRLTGPHALSHTGLCIGAFAGHPHLIQTRDGAECTTQNATPLTAMQLIFRDHIATSP